jgi:hypothetical protein
MSARASNLHDAPSRARDRLPGSGLRGESTLNVAPDLELGIMPLDFVVGEVLNLSAFVNLASLHRLSIPHSASGSERIIKRWEQFTGKQATLETDA